MSEQIKRNFRELVELKYQLYNSLFLTLPLDAIQQTGLLLPLLQEDCRQGLRDGAAPDDIIDRFFQSHRPELSEQEQISFLFKVIQYVERQVVLIDALEEAAYNRIHRTADSGNWERIRNKADRLNLNSRLSEVLKQFSLRLVLTAHPTQFYPGRILAIATDLKDAIRAGNTAYTRDLLQQLGKTPFYRKEKPSVMDEALALTWYLGKVFYPAIGEMYDRMAEVFPVEALEDSRLIQLGFWPGGDRDGNPFVRVDTTLEVARKLRSTLFECYLEDLSRLKRRLSFAGVYERMAALEQMVAAELKSTRNDGELKLEFLRQELSAIREVIVADHQGLFTDQLDSFRRKVNLFGFHFASLDIRQDSRVIHRSLQALLQKHPDTVPAGFSDLSVFQQVEVLVGIRNQTDLPDLEDEVLDDTLKTFGVIRQIQQQNGEAGAHRFIISNCRGALDVARVMALARVCAWGEDPLTLDIVPLFETISDLSEAGSSMEQLYALPGYRTHLASRGNRQTVMLGFSDGTKDGGYLMANWSIYRAKEEVTRVSRHYGVEVIFFDGRGGPPARGGGNAHLFYSAMGQSVENKQIQLTVQGQTISSHYGIRKAAVHNLGHLLTAGLENNLFNREPSEWQPRHRELIDRLAQVSYEKYQSLKQHAQFLPFLEQRTTLKYYGMANIGSRPAKRGSDKKLVFEDLRAIPFVGAWSQLKQNVPGFFGVGSALKALTDQGHLEELTELYQQSVFFRALISNSMQSMAKTNFNLTRYMEKDPVFGPFWSMIYQEFLLSKEMVLRISGQKQLLEDNDRSRLSIRLREDVVLPLLVIQQYGLIQVQRAIRENRDEYLTAYERMVMRSLFGNINASRNSV